MPATGFESRPRGVSNDSARRHYYVTGADTEDDVVTWLGANVPLVVAGLPFADFQADEVEEIAGDYEVEVHWGVGRPQLDSPGEMSYRFSFQAPTAHVYQSLSTISATHDPNLMFGPPDFGGAINVVWDGDKRRVEGFNLQPPAEVFTLTYTDDDLVIDTAYQEVIEALCGKVNSAAFRGKVAGEVMLTRVDGSRSGGLWTIEFGFGYIPNATSIPVGDAITVPAKDGMDLLWVYYLPHNDASSKALLQKPAAAMVERVFERADLTLLNLPS